MPPTLITLKALLFSLSLLALPPAPLLAQTDGKAAQPVSVSVAEVSQQRLPSLIEITGTLQAAQRAVIAAKITGVITQIPVELGSAVKAGDLLVTISAEEIAARLDQTEARLAQARRNLEREQNLLRKNAATPETVKSMHDQANIAQAGYREARAMLDAANITAPFDGVVTRKKARSGDLATPGAILLHLEKNRTLQVISAVPESLMLRIRPGDVLTVKVEAAGVALQGTVSEISPAIDPISRTAPVVLDLPVSPDLRSGQFARVLLPGTDSQTLMVPSSALAPSGQMDRVFAVEGERARLRLVRTGLSLNGMTEILTGLNAGETVVTSNNRLLIDGQLLRIEP
jgi:membrane fusion protein, multidrug efflux system